MQFCPKCGAILVKKTKNYGCPRCSYSTKEEVNMKTSEKMEKKKEVAVAGKSNTETKPIVNEKCKECSNDKAYFWEVQTRASDESPTKFFKCTKCGFTWRSYR